MAVAFQFDFESTVAAITYLTSKDLPGLTKYKLCKLLFLADKYHLVKYGRVITGDKYCALPYGPIPSRILNLLNAVVSEIAWDKEAVALSEVLILDRQYMCPRFSSAQGTNSDQLSQSDILALDKVIAIYGQMGFEELRAITHEMFAYKQAWSSKSDDAKGVDMDFEAFFEEDSDAIVGARDVMIEDDLLRKVFPEL